VHIPRPGRLVGPLAAVVAAIAAVIVLLLVLSAVRLLPQLRNPFHTTTTVRSQPPLLKSITSLSRYEAASGTFQVVVDLSKRMSFLPSFIAGSQTLFVADGTVIAYVNFGGLKGSAITVSAGHAVTITLPRAQLEPAVLNVGQSSPSRKALSTGSATSSLATRTASKRSTSWPSRRSRTRRAPARCARMRSATRPPCSTACWQRSATSTSPSTTRAPE
jgi:hypothetical protein